MILPEVRNILRDRAHAREFVDKLLVFSEKLPGVGMTPADVVLHATWEDVAKIKQVVGRDLRIYVGELWPDDPYPSDMLIYGFRIRPAQVR